MTRDLSRQLQSGRPLIIDSFAGGGGASTAIEQALGVSPDVAINHNPEALALHAANHPETEHLITSIYAVDPRDVVKRGQRVGLAWFSPDCKHFSKAKGGKPLNKNIRDLAWVVVHWAELVRPEVIALENVEEFTTWAPLRQRHDAAGKPVFNKDGTPYMEVDPERKGETFLTWARRLRRMGYRVEWRLLRACDFGAPTIRKRLFLVARCDGRPIVWPKPTHGDPASAEVQSGKLLPWRTAAECIDWSVPCPSIFATKAEIKEQHGLNAVRPLADNTQARIARGMKRYVLDAARPFVVNLTHGARLEDADEPLRTITGANRGEKAVVSPLLATFYGHGEGRGKRAADLKEPLRTVTVENRHALVAPSLLSLKGSARRDSAATMPHPTVLAGGGHSALIAPSLISVAHGYSGGRREYPLTEPKGTITSGGISHAVVAPILTYAQHGGANRNPLDPVHTLTASTKDNNSLLAATMVQVGYGERDGQAPRALNPGAPLGTVVAGGVKHAGVAAFLAQHNSQREGVHPGRPIDAPISTLTASGSHQNLIAPWFVKYYGTGDGSRTDAPCHTVTVKDRFAHMQAELAPTFGPEHETRARQVAEFLRRHDAWDGGEFVTLEIDGETFVIVDIGMRMLTPRELFTAQGFPPDYVIEGTWAEQDGEWIWKPFPKSVQISCCGNSVSPHPARALLEANCAHLREEMEREAA